MKKVKIMILGKVGTGKIAIAGVIEEALKAKGINISGIVDISDNRPFHEIVSEPMYHEVIENISKTTEVRIEVIQTAVEPQQN